MEHKWAPWRMEYIEQKKSEDCIFCNKEEEMVIMDNEEFIIMMNKFPYNNGHIMVAPLKHNTMLEALSEDESNNLMRGIQLGISIIKRAYQPDGINVGINMGQSAGAGIDDHLHVHIVPRWNGDTNFMPIFADTKLISEGLAQTKIRLQKALKELQNE